MTNIIDRIVEMTLEDIMGDRFARYSKYIIQDRALPDVRDGLKPVQRRILYAMYKEGNTHNKPFRKSAKTVGNVIGNFHPHGDASVYDAMVRMSQDWKVRNVLVEMHGNNGSIDGDSAAAMRYTEARLSPIALELLRDIDKDTVEMAPNFDDSLLEPTVLPSYFPNLLVNGSTGISAGYATNIPPHNLEEVIDATIKKIDSPNVRLDTILNIIKGPDFPTGGIVEDKNALKEAYETGRGKIIVRAKASFEKNNGKDQIVITEIPYEVNKAELIRKIDLLRIDKKLDEIVDARDESDRNGLRIVIDLKKGADREFLLNYLYKNTDLQINYNFNMVAIVDRRPKQLGLLEIIDAYIKHARDVVRRRTEFDLEHAEKRLHIVEGIIKALSILDDVIKIIRSSTDKANAKENLINKYNFSERQAEAIVMLQLYKLTNTDVTLLEEEKEKLNELIKELKTILSDEKVLDNVIKEELKRIKKEYPTPRKTIISESITKIEIDETKMIPQEEVVVVVTRDGYIKRSSIRSFSASEENEVGIKEDDYIIGYFQMNTIDKILLFTEFGNYLYIPVFEIPETKWKDLGRHVSSIIDIEDTDNIVSAISVRNFSENKYVTIFTKNGLVKRTSLSEFEVTRYSRPITAIKMKKDDSVVGAYLTEGDENVFIATRNGYGLYFDINEISIIGTRAQGVKGINLKNDTVVSGLIVKDADTYISVFTENGNAKRVKLSEFDLTSRAKRGVLILREVKSNPDKVLKVLNGETEVYILKTEMGIEEIKATEITIGDRYYKGAKVTNNKLIDVAPKEKLIVINEDINKTEKMEEAQVFLEGKPKEKETKVKTKTKQAKSKKETKKKEVNLEEIDMKILSIDDFLDDIDL